MPSHRHPASRHVHPLLGEELSDEFRRQGYWEGLTLAQIVEDWARRDAGRPAVVGPHPLTYGQLWEQARRVAAVLREGGFRTGECLLAVMPNSWQGVVLEVAASVLGAVFAPRSAHISPTLMLNLFEQLDGRGFVIQSDLLANEEWTAAVAEIESRLGERPLMAQGDAADAGAAYPRLEDAALDGPLADPVEPDPAQPCLVLSTGGTTGVPKSILHNSESLVYAARHFAAATEFTEADTHVGFAPYGHAGGSIVDIYMPLVMGARVLPIARWRARAVAEAIARYGGTFFVTMGTHVFDLLELDSSADELLRSVRLITSGAGPDELFERGERRFGVKILRVYGCGECPGHAIGRVEDPPEDRLRQDGVPFPGIEYRRVDPHTGKPVGLDELGEYQCRGPNLFMGYVGQPELTSEAVTEDGFYRSGDLMAGSEDGYITWAGRTKEIIRRGGLQIDPVEMENMLSRHPQVASAVVVGAPDPRLGERAVIVAVAHSSKGRPDLDELRAYLQQQGLPKGSLPERLVFVDAIPRTELGKFHRAEVKRLLAELDEAAGQPA